MIFVTVGTHNYEFTRLVKIIDSIAEKIDEDFFIQYGNSKHIPRNCKGIQWLDGSKMAHYLSTADVIITHAGAGSILSSLISGKPLIIIPRKQSLGEHIDDHQFQLARKMEDSDRAVVLFEPTASTMIAAIETIKKKQPENLETKSELVMRLSQQLDLWNDNKN